MNGFDILNYDGPEGQQTVSYHTNSRLQCKQQVILTSSKLF